MEKVMSILQRLFDRENSKVLLLVAVTKLLIIGIALLHPIIPFGRALNEGNLMYRVMPESFLHQFEAFDGQWYIQIAEEGYQKKPVLQKQCNYNFFPLYPMMIRVVALAAQSTSLAALIVSYISTFLMALLFYRLLRLDYDESTSWRALLYMLIFPSAFFFSTAYTEALYMTCLLGAFYCARKDLWLPASLCGFLAAFTRKPGVFILIPLLILYLIEKKARNEKIRLDIASLLLIPLAPVFFALYVSTITGSFFSIFSTTAGWGAKLSIPLLSFFQNWDKCPILAYQGGMLDRIATIAFTAMLIPMWKKLRKEYWIYALLVIFVPLTVGTTGSMTRYLLVSFPHFIYLSEITRGEERSAAVTVLFSVLLGIYTLLFVSWYWV